MIISFINQIENIEWLEALNLLIPLFAVAFTYYLGKKQQRNKNYYSQLEKAVEEIISPLYHDLIEISLHRTKGEMGSYNNKLKKIFENYLHRDAKLYLSLNPNIISNLLRNGKLYDLNQLKQVEVAKFSREVEIEYWDLFNTFSNEHHFKKSLLNRGILWGTSAKILNSLYYIFCYLITLLLWSFLIVLFLNSTGTLGVEWSILNFMLIVIIGAILAVLHLFKIILLDTYLVKTPVNNEKYIIKELTKDIVRGNLNDRINGKIDKFLEWLLERIKNWIEKRKDMHDKKITK